VAYTKPKESSTRWFSPYEYVEVARNVMGGIDLDPASEEWANENIIKAEEYYDAEIDGLSKEWEGRIWLNPPHGAEAKPPVRAWIQKAIEEYVEGRLKEACILVPAATAQQWFAPLWDFPMCFIKHRVSFISHKTHEIAGNQAPTPYVLVYIPRDYEAVRVFAKYASKVGYVVAKVEE
jgi:phage N-6-adenine-methyltransferase